MELPLPKLQVRNSAGLCFLTDEELFAAAGVRMGFTRRQGGVSLPPYDSLNLGSHVGDNRADVRENRLRLLEAAGLRDTQLLCLNQVHGSEVLTLSEEGPKPFASVVEGAEQGADGIAVGVPGVTALLCFADCVPVVVASPSGAFAVAHAGWRGALAGIPAKAAAALEQIDAKRGHATSPSDYNGYIGPHIMAECYECGQELVSRFVERYGRECAWQGTHLNLEAAVRASLWEAGLSPERIASVGECTACNFDIYFSYRQSGGTCGRHGAFAGRKE